MNPSKKILVIQRDNSLSGDGGSVGSRRNLTLLKRIYGEENIDIIYIMKPSFLDRALSFVFNTSYGKRRKIIRFLRDYDFSKCLFAFIDGSLEGEYVQRLHNKGIVTIIYYHNVECNYYSDMYSSKPSIFSFAMKVYSYRQERLTTLYSSYRILLNERDASELQRVYRKQADLLLPTSFDPINPPHSCAGEYDSCRPYALFVGSNFFANVQGISWFIDNVLPSLKLNLVVAGSISRYLESKYRKTPSNLIVLGYVDNLLPLYANAACVVAPIFLGSGLKTKTIEALMYGKTIFGTTEAFQGVKLDFSKAGALCNTSEEFISSMNSFFESARDSTFNQYSYVFFSKNFSNDVSLKHFKLFLKDKNLL